MSKPLAYAHMVNGEVRGLAFGPGHIIQCDIDRGWSDVPLCKAPSATVIDTIGILLAQAMDKAVDGANNRPIPDEYIETAAWLYGRQSC